MHQRNTTPLDNATAIGYITPTPQYTTAAPTKMEIHDSIVLIRRAVETGDFPNLNIKRSLLRSINQLGEDMNVGDYEHSPEMEGMLVELRETLDDMEIETTAIEPDDSADDSDDDEDDIDSAAADDADEDDEDDDSDDDSEDSDSENEDEDDDSDEDDDEDDDDLDDDDNDDLYEDDDEDDDDLDDEDLDDDEDDED